MQSPLFDGTSSVCFISLGSGSSGNSYYLSSAFGAILIDAGLPVRTIQKGLRQHGVELHTINALLLTHEHTDHVRSAATLAGSYGMTVYAAEPLFRVLDRRPIYGCIPQRVRQFIMPGSTFEVAGFRVEAFLVPHDASINLGYHIVGEGFAFTFMSDIGHITPEMPYFAERATHLVLEANYDPEMLRLGTYPPYLKTRIQGPLGHLSNIEAADFLASVAHSSLQHVFLCHLSQQNNHPLRCLETFQHRLTDCPIFHQAATQLVALPRHKTLIHQLN